MSQTPMSVHSMSPCPTSQTLYTHIHVPVSNPTSSLCVLLSCIPIFFFPTSLIPASHVPVPMKPTSPSSMSTSHHPISPPFHVPCRHVPHLMSLCPQIPCPHALTCLYPYVPTPIPIPPPPCLPCPLCPRSRWQPAQGSPAQPDVPHLPGAGWGTGAAAVGGSDTGPAPSHCQGVAGWSWGHRGTQGTWRDVPSGSSLGFMDPHPGVPPPSCACVCTFPVPMSLCYPIPLSSCPPMSCATHFSKPKSGKRMLFLMRRVKFSASSMTGLEERG